MFKEKINQSEHPCCSIPASGDTSICIRKMLELGLV